MESSYSETPATQPNFGLEVIVPSLLIAGAAYLIVATADDANGGHIVGASVLIIVLFWRLWRWDENGRPVHIRERTRYLDDPQPELRPFVQQDGRRIRVGKWRFTRAEWQRLGRAIGDKLTRRSIDDLQRDDGDRMFPNITEVYGDIVEELQRVGFIDADNAMTDRGRAWFDDPSSALPAD